MTIRTSPPSASNLAGRLRGFGPMGVVAALVIIALGGLGGVLVLAWARISETPWRDLGLVRPASWARTVIIGMVAGLAFKLLMKAIVMPMLGADPVNQAYHFLVGNRAALPAMLLTVVFRAGFGEEVVFRGFLFERLGRLLGDGSGAKVVIVLLTSVFFGAVHYPDQGFDGAVQATITGLAFGTAFAITGRLWGVIFAHAAFDVTAVAIIYFDCELAVARFFFN